MNFSTYYTNTCPVWVLAAEKAAHVRAVQMKPHTPLINHKMNESSFRRRFYGAVISGEKTAARLNI
jgi:hypothetical protein